MVSVKKLISPQKKSSQDSQLGLIPLPGRPIPRRNGLEQSWVFPPQGPVGLEPFLLSCSPGFPLSAGEKNLEKLNLFKAWCFFWYIGDFVKPNDLKYLKHCISNCLIAWCFFGGGVKGQSYGDFLQKVQGPTM